MKILFVGLGSIGQRHLRNIQRVYRGKLEIFAFCPGKKTLVIDDDMKAHRGKDCASYYGIREFRDLSAALKEKPGIAFITNPTSLHLPYALACAHNGAHLFIEKPLSHSWQGVEELARVCRRRRLVVAVGYQMRFHPFFQKMRALLLKKKLGKIVRVEAKFVTYLPQHHPYEDYRVSYAARKALGGGAILCLIHEIDMLYALFGTPVQVRCGGGKLSALAMDVEDTAQMTFGYPGGFSAALELSLAQKKEQRFLEVVGEKGVARIDFCRNEFTCFLAGSTKGTRVVLRDFKRNELFMQEAKAFLRCVRQRKSYEPGLKAAMATLKIALAAKESMRRHTTILL